MNGQMRVFFDERETQLKLEEYHSRMDDEVSSTGTYAEMVDEVEKISDVLQETRSELKSTQERLWDEAKKSKVLELRLETEESEIKLITSENEVLMKEEQRLRDEVERLEKVIGGRDTRQAHPTTEERLKKAVELLNKDLRATKEKLEVAQITVASQKSLIERLDRSGRMLKVRCEQVEGVESVPFEEFQTCQMNLKEAQLQSSDLLEEVAGLREELKIQKNLTAHREAQRVDVLVSQEKERIRVQEREATTKLVTHKIRKEISAELNTLKEKEINTLRGEFKKLFKENSLLKEKLEVAEAVAGEADRLEQEAPKLKYEVTRLLGLLEATREESAAVISELQSNFRLQAQEMQEKFARDKWTQTSEIRKQLSKEREKELNDFKHRMESLANETSRLLEKAEQDKQQYGEEIKKKITEEKQLEIDSLKGKLMHFVNEAEDLLEDAALDKEDYADQIRKQIEEDMQREVVKHTCRIEVLEREKETLESRVITLEQEAEHIREENENLMNHMKEAEINLKDAEAKVFNIERKNEVLGSKVERYKSAHDGLLEELRNPRKSSNNTPGDWRRKSKSGVQNPDELRWETSNETRNSRSKQKNADLTVSFNPKDESSTNIENSLASTSTDLEIEQLKEQVETTNLLLHQYRHERTEISKQFGSSKHFEEDITVASQDTSQLNNEIKKLEQDLHKYNETNADFERFPEGPDDDAKWDRVALGDEDFQRNGGRGEPYETFERAPASDSTQRQEQIHGMREENAFLKDKIEDLNHILEKYRKELTETSKELHSSKLALVSEGKAASGLQKKVETLNILLETTEHHSAKNSKELKQAKTNFETARSAVEEEINSLKTEIENLNLALSNATAEIDDLNDALSEANNQFEGIIDKGKIELKVSQGEVAGLTGEIHRLQQELKRCETSHASISKELQNAKSLFNEELAKSEGIIFRLKERVELLAVSPGGETDTKQIYSVLVTAEKKNREHIDRLENLLSRAARESLKLSKRLHECDIRFHVFLSDFDDGSAATKALVEKHSSDVEGSRSENVRISTEQKNTMRCLREALLNWKEYNSRFRGTIEALKIQSTPKHHTVVDSSEAMVDDDSADCAPATTANTKAHGHSSQEDNKKGILKYENNSVSKRKRVTWNTSGERSGPISAFFSSMRGLEDPDENGRVPVSENKETSRTIENPTRQEEMEKLELDNSLSDDIVSLPEINATTSSCIDPPGESGSQTEEENFELEYNSARNIRSRERRDDFGADRPRSIHGYLSTLSTARLQLVRDKKISEPSELDKNVESEQESGKQTTFSSQQNTEVEDSKGDLAKEEGTKETEHKGSEDTTRSKESKGTPSILYALSRKSASRRFPTRGLRHLINRRRSAILLSSGPSNPAPFDERQDEPKRVPKSLVLDAREIRIKEER